nr:oligopeptidase B [Spirosomataceae bacterium]
MTKRQDTLQIPVAPKKPYFLETHGDRRLDEYYWLREREEEEVAKYLNAENAYAEQVLAPVKKLRERLFEEMKARIKEQDESVPYREGNYFYYSRYEKGGEYPIYCRKFESLANEEEIMLNLNELAKDKPYYNATFPEISDNEETAAFGEDTLSRRLYTLRFKNLKTGEFYPEVILDTEGGNYAWAADNQTIFYIKKDPETLLGYQVWRHKLGNEPTQDVLVYEETDDQNYIGLFRMKSKKYIAIISDQNGVATEYQLLEANQPEGSFRSFLPRQRGHEYFLEHKDDTFYIRTNWGDATNFKLCTA